MSPSCTIDGNITANVYEAYLEVTNDGYVIVGMIDRINSNFRHLIEYLESRDNSDNTIRSIRIQEDQNIREETCNGIFDGATYDYQRDGTIRFRIEIREVPELSRS